VKNCDDMLSCFHLIPKRNGQTDRQTDGQICYINIARQYVLTRDKNQQFEPIHKRPFVVSNKRIRGKPCGSVMHLLLVNILARTFSLSDQKCRRR